MSHVAQYVIVGLIVASAVGYVGAHLRRLLQGRTSGSCSACAARSRSAPIVHVTSIRKRFDQERFE